jgi:hypothetical protein
MGDFEGLEVKPPMCRVLLFGFSGDGGSEERELRREPLRLQVPRIPRKYARTSVPYHVYGCLWPERNLLQTETN